MFRYLSAHPQVRRPLRKEIDYFSVDYSRPWPWYQAHFPLPFGGRVSFDATPQYFVHPLAPERLRTALPAIKLVLSIRDPVDRTISHHQLMTRIGIEALPIERALDQEASRIGPDIERLHQYPDHVPLDFLRFSYLARSRYGEQLHRWLQSFPLSSFHFLCFDTFIREPKVEWDHLLEFLGLDLWCPTSFTNWSTPTSAPAINENLRSDIWHRLADDPKRFAAMVPRGFPWET